MTKDMNFRPTNSCNLNKLKVALNNEVHNYNKLLHSIKFSKFKILEETKVSKYIN